MRASRFLSYSFCPHSPLFPFHDYRVTLSWRCLHLYIVTHSVLSTVAIFSSLYFFSNSQNHSFLWIIKPKTFPVFSPPTLLFSCLKLVFVLNIFAVSAYSPHPKVFCFWWIITTLNIPNRVVKGKTERWKVVASGKWAFERPSIGRFQLCLNA